MFCVCVSNYCVLKFISYNNLSHDEISRRSTFVLKEAGFLFQTDGGGVVLVTSLS